MSKTAFLTGASGFVGGHLARQLLQQDWQVTALVRQSSSLEDAPGDELDLKYGDITDVASLKAAIPANVDCVFHVAASTNTWSRNNQLQTRTNIEGTRNLVQAAIEAKAGRFIHTSSFAVWGQQNRSINEDSPRYTGTDWINYIRTKYAAETIVKAAVLEGGLDAVILNPAHILGPGDHHNWSRVIRLVNSGDLPGIPPGGGAFADVREIAKAHIQAYEHGQRGQNYLLGGEDTQYIDLVRTIGEILDRPVPKRPVPGLVLKAVARIRTIKAGFTGREPDLTPEAVELILHHIEVDCSRARTELGYRFTPVRKLLEETCRWMQDKGML